MNAQVKIENDIEQYWDKVAGQRTDGKFNDNIWKRSEIVRRILEWQPIGASILEIGVGNGLAAAVINLLTLGNIKYTGTDVSGVFADFVRKRWKLNIVKTDAGYLPDGPFDMVWAFDTLEHVHPGKRLEAYAEINRVLANPGLIMLNVPLSESQHDMHFDFPFGSSDIAQLANACGAHIAKCERYEIPDIDRAYQFVVLQR